MSMDHAVAYQFVKKYFKDKMKDDVRLIYIFFNYLNF